MYYKVISLENFSDLEKIAEDVKQKAIKLGLNYSESISISILGKDAIEKFGKMIGKNFKFAEPIKTDGKAKVEFVHYVTGYCYFNSSRNEFVYRDFWDYNPLGYLVKYDGMLLHPHIKNGKAEYFNIFNDNTDYSKNLPWYWENENPHPNKIGTITEKKINDWKEWLSLRRNLATSVIEEKDSRIREFLDRIRKFDFTKCTKYDIGESRGYIVKNGLKFSYSIDNSKCIDQRIEIYYSSGNTLETFEKMANGIY